MKKILFIAVLGVFFSLNAQAQDGTQTEATNVTPTCQAKKMDGTSPSCDKKAEQKENCNMKNAESKTAAGDTNSDDTKPTCQAKAEKTASCKGNTDSNAKASCKTDATKNEKSCCSGKKKSKKMKKA